MTGPEERLFERYCRTREPKALAAVFDRLAPDLLRIAMHVCGRAADAEDALQATFVAAIERALAWDERRELFPWLIGILVREAARLRRSERRAPEAARLAVGGVEDPQQEACTRELDAAVASALVQLGELYRPVVHLHLLHGLGGKEIAAALGRRPDQVRQQLARGLRQLRGLLPSGFAVFAAVAFVGSRGLAAVRTAVLDKALAKAAAAAGGAAVGVGGLGFALGSTFMTKHLLAGALALLLGLLWWWSAVAPRAPAVGASTDPDVAATAASVEVRTGEAPPLVDAAQARVAVAAAGGSLRVRMMFALQAEARRRGASSPCAMCDVAIELWPGAEGELASLEAPRAARTDDEGQVLVAGLAPGPWHVRRAGSDRHHGRAVVLAGQTVEVVLPGIAADYVRGRVVDERGAPVAGASVLLCSEGGQYRSNWLYGVLQSQSSLVPPDRRQRRAAVADQDGRFEAVCCDDEFVVFAAAPGHVPSRPQLTKDLGAGELVLTLGGEPGLVEGTVVDSGGLPVDDAVVALYTVSGRPHRQQDGTLVLARVPAITRSDARGAFRFAEVGAGSYQVCARGTGHMPDQAAVELAAGGRRDVQLRLAEAAAVVGRVTDQHGAALAGLQVRVTSDRASPGYMASASTDGAGGFAVANVPRRPFVVLIEQAGRCLAERAFAEPAARNRCDLTIEVAAPLPGRVVDAGGNGLAGWRIVIELDAGVQLGTGAVSDEAGRFHAQRSRAGTGRLRAIAPEGNFADADVALDLLGTEAEVLVQVPDDRFASISGTLRDPAGAALPLAELWLRRPGEPNRRGPVACDGAGHFRIERLPPGTFELQVLASGRDRCVLSAVTVARGQVLELGDVVVAPAARLVISFLQADGTPWPRAVPDVAITDARERLHGEGFVVRAGGLAVDLPAGDYRVSVDEPDLLADPAHAELRSGQRTELRLVLRVGRRRELVFEGERDVAIDRTAIAVVVRGERGDVVAEQTLRRSPHGDGNWTCERTLPFGLYRIEARTESGVLYGGEMRVTPELDESVRVVVPRLP